MENSADYRGVVSVILPGVAGYSADMEEEYEYQSAPGWSDGVSERREFPAL